MNYAPGAEHISEQPRQQSWRRYRSLLSGLQSTLSDQRLYGHRSATYWSAETHILVRPAGGGPVTRATCRSPPPPRSKTSRSSRRGARIDVLAPE